MMIKGGIANMPNMTRIQFELSKDKVKELEDIMEESGIRTKKDLFNNALTLLEWAIRESKAGRVIASIDEKGKKYKEILMPILAAICRREKAKKEKVKS